MKLRNAGVRAALPVVLALGTFCLSAVSAQTAAQAEPGVSVENRRSAADAYDKGTAAYLSADYELAAHWFEHAYRLAPTSTALIQAVRARHRAGQELRAANLTLLMQERYPSEESARDLAETILRNARQDNVLVRATCEGECALEIDAELAEHHSFFVTPGEEHVVKAQYDRGETETTVSGPAGSSRTVQLPAPPPPATPPVPRWAFFSSLGATVAVGTLTIWSGVDANHGVDAYEDAATRGNAALAQDLLEQGQRKETRTNALIGTTAAMVGVTTVLGVFTDWKGHGREAKPRSIEPSMAFDKNGGFAGLRGRF